MNIKQIGISPTYSSYKELKENHVIAQGWSGFGDLTFAYYVKIKDENGKEDYNKFVEHDCGEKGAKNAFSQLLTEEIQPHDIILAFEGKKLMGIAEMPDDFIYFFNNNMNEYKNCLFPVQWVDWEVFCLEAKLKNFVTGAYNGIVGIENTGSQELKSYIEKNWENFKKVKNHEIQPKECKEQLDFLKKNFKCKRNESRAKFYERINKEIYSRNMEKYVKLLETNHNFILTGAPGTGKTYLAKQIAEQMIFESIKEKMDDKDKENILKEHCGFVQLHPSYDYTDFVEGLRPTNEVSSEQIGFERTDGIFKEFCKKAIEKIDSKAFDDAFDKLLIDVGEGQLTLKTKNGNQFAVSINSKGNLKLLTGKELKENGVLTRERTKAEFKGENPYQYWKSYYKGVIDYLKTEYNLKKEEKKYNCPYIFIIDEINRGEISKIFGELFFSIDPGYRGEKGLVKTQYQNLVEQGDVFYDGFYVPENVYVIGTMNDIDRSVESMDFAFRRRFAFYEITAEESKGMLKSDDAWGKDSDNNSLKPSDQEIETIKNKMDALNNLIWHKAKEGESEDAKCIEGLSSAYHIGASYFLKLANYRDEKKYNDNSFNKLWDNHLEGLLREYMRGMQGVEEKIAKLKEAFNNPQAADKDDTGDNQ